MLSTFKGISRRRIGTILASIFIGSTVTFASVTPQTYAAEITHLDNQQVGHHRSQADDESLNPFQWYIDTTNLKKDSGDNYVAIGDSWAGSTFIATMRPDPCMRNRIGYPEITSFSVDLQLRNTACAGAKLSSYWKPSSFISGIRPTEFPLLYKSSMNKAIDKETKLVTIQLGILEFQNFWCIPDRIKDLTPKKCERYVRHRFNTIRPYLVPAYRSMYKDAKRRAHKDALIVGIGYSRMFIEDKFCWDGIIVAPSTRKLLDELQEELNAAAKQAAKEAGVQYYNLSSDTPYLHSSCGVPLARYVSGLAIVEGSTAFHPTFRWHIQTASDITKLYQAHKMSVGYHQGGQKKLNNR